ncbi:hypothetical protein KR009_007712, partial [Drosophila setifemur]
SYVQIVYKSVIFFQFNGYDISHLPRCEAVQMFLQAKETIVVELRRQKQNNDDFKLKNEAIANVENEDDVVLNGFNVKKCETPLLPVIQKSTDASSKDATIESVDSVPFIVPADPTAITSNNKQVILTLRALSNEERSSCPTVFAASKDTQTSVNNDTLKDRDLLRTVTDHFVEQEHHLFEQCLEPEIDIEEITLNTEGENATSNIMGLSVCSTGFQSSNMETSKEDIFCTNSEFCEDVFISGIKLESIADRDGRLRRGDQILRINGIDVKNKEDAETQIAESSTTVTLLVSRLLYPDDDDEDIESNFEYANSFITDDYTNVVDKLDKVLLSHVQSINPINEISNEEVVHSTKCLYAPSEKKQSDQNIKATALLKKNFEQYRKTCNKTKFHSGEILNNKKTIDQSFNKDQSNLHYEYDENEHIYETIPEDSESEPLYCSPYQSSNYITSMSPVEMEADSLETTIHQQTQRVAQWLGLKSQCPRTLNTLIDQNLTTKSVQQPTCSRIFTLHSTMTSTSRSSSSGNAYSACGLNNIVSRNLGVGEEVDNSSSAYNTGDSNNSASPRQIISNVDDENITNQKLHGTVPNGSSTLSPTNAFVTSPISSVILLPFGKSGRIGLCTSNMPSAYVCESQSKAFIDTENIMHKSDVKLMRVKQLEEPHSHCPQFNAPNLSRYHFVSSQEVANKDHISTSSKQNTELINIENVDEIPMVWKVKRRPDGSRYIVKRPVRNRGQVAIRKNVRGNELTTTEEDTVSEVKIGRYWTKEERKRHIERARERRHHQTQLQ